MKTTLCDVYVVGSVQRSVQSKSHEDESHEDEARSQKDLAGRRRSLRSRIEGNVVLQALQPTMERKTSRYEKPALVGFNARAIVKAIDT